MTTTDTRELATTCANMAYLNSRGHRSGLRAALQAVGVYDLPQGSATRDDAFEAALAAYPHRDHPRTRSRPPWSSPPWPGPPARPASPFDSRRFR
ncbi:hypothetical protein [Nocardia sp. NPDC059239]|uniref:hypothetical protein n=1 Tax=Nocardia sp. NPDC059239 TaxID=3346785 RepID=UPI0036A0BCEC